MANVVTEGTGTALTGLLGCLLEEERTNSILQSRQFDTTWAQAGTPVLTQDQAGIDGVANTAWTIEDDDAGAKEWINQGVVIDNDSNTHCLSFSILKDADTSRFPEVQMNLTGGTLQAISVHINTSTGAITVASSTGTVTSNSKLVGLFWRITLTVANNSTGNVTMTMWLNGAGATVAGTPSAAATGSCVLDAVQHEKSAKFSTSFIETTTVAVQRNKSELSFVSTGVINDTEGSVLLDWTPSYDVANGTAFSVLMTSTTGATFLTLDNTTKRILSYDGTVNLVSTVDYVAGTTYKVGLTWDSGGRKIYIAGSLDASGTYDGAWTDGGSIYLGSRSGTLHDTANYENTRIYRKALSQAVMENLTT